MCEINAHGELLPIQVSPRLPDFNVDFAGRRKAGAQQARAFISPRAKHSLRKDHVNIMGTLHTATGISNIYEGKLETVLETVRNHLYLQGKLGNRPHLYKAMNNLTFLQVKTVSNIPL